MPEGVGEIIYLIYCGTFCRFEVVCPDPKRVEL